MNKYDELKARIEKATGIDTIVLTINNVEIIVDDYAAHKCLLHVGTMYGAMHVVTGYLSDCNVTEQDLINFNILEPMPEMLDTDYIKPFEPVSIWGKPFKHQECAGLYKRTGALPEHTLLFSQSMKLHKLLRMRKYNITDDEIKRSAWAIARYRNIVTPVEIVVINRKDIWYKYEYDFGKEKYERIHKKRLINQIIKYGRHYALDSISGKDFTGGKHVWEF